MVEQLALDQRVRGSKPLSPSRRIEQILASGSSSVGERHAMCVGGRWFNSFLSQLKEINMTTGKPPLFDPEEDVTRTEADKWRIAYEAADHHRGRKPGINKSTLAMLAICATLTIVSGLLGYWLISVAR